LRTLRLERRYDTTSTVFCTQYAKKDWHQRLGSGVHADAIMDRIVHRNDLNRERRHQHARTRRGQRGVIQAGERELNRWRSPAIPSGSEEQYPVAPNRNNWWRSKGQILTRTTIFCRQYHLPIKRTTPVG
jgi:hypothetical protein